MKTVKHLKPSTVAKAVAVALSTVGASAAFAVTLNIDPFDLGLLKNFNIVAQDSIYVRTSDMQCGMAAKNDMNIYGGYSVGNNKNVNAEINGTTVVTTYAKAPLGMLIGDTLNWGAHITATSSTNNKAVIAPPSGTINGDVFYSQKAANLIIAKDASITLTPPGKLFDVDPLINGNANNSLDLLSYFAPGYTPAVVPWNSIGTSASTNAAVKIIAAVEATPSAGWGLGTASTSFYSDLRDPSKFPATGTTVASTFYNAPTAANAVSWPVQPGEARYNIDLTDVISDADRGMGTTPSTVNKFSVNQLYVFDVDATQLSAADTLRLNNVRNFSDDNNNKKRDGTEKASWIIIRVNAASANTTVRFGSMGMQALAGMATRTLWVFDKNITTIQIGGTSFEGTMVAPNATVEALNGQFNGTMFVKNFAGPGNAVQPKAYGNVTGAGTNASPYMVGTELGTYPGTLEGHCAVYDKFPGAKLWKP